MRQAKFNRTRPVSSKKSLIVKKSSTGSRQYSDSGSFEGRNSSTDSRPNSDSRSFGGRKSPTGSRPISDSKPFGIKKSSPDSRSYSDSKSFGGRKSPADSKPYSDSKSFGGRKSSSESRPYSDSKTFGIKKSSAGSKPYSDSKPFVVKTSSSDQKAFANSKPFAAKNSPAGAKPFAAKKPQAAKKTFASRAPSVDTESLDSAYDVTPATELQTEKKPKAEKKPKPPKKLDPDKCSKCLKLHSLCICPEILALETDLHVLILQHPQEPDEDLGSARLAHLSLKNSTLKIGLSWANLSKALGREAQPAKWTVLHLGSGIKGTPTTSNLQFVSKQGAPIDPPKDLEGIVVLDGTWSQAKALWWRNPWLLKLKRSVLTPQEKSLYRELRKEPRQECLSTIESVAETLDALGEPNEIKTQLNAVFKSLLGKYRDLKKAKKKALAEQ
ncbi:MAG: DTW domain-containing protein [Bdellovibrionia bacterium]